MRRPLRSGRFTLTPPPPPTSAAALVFNVVTNSQYVPVISF